MNQRTAIAKINKAGALLVFPINNRKEPRSLWSEFFPRSKMRWEWNDSGDDRVSNMWFLMKKLSDCREVVYSKWYQSRATFFSRDLFRAMLAIYMQADGRLQPLTRPARTLLDTLEMDSPLSTKELKRATDMQGRYNEPIYQRALKELFHRLQIVGFGEVDDGAFPSLAVGASKLIYEDLWLEAQGLTKGEAQATINKWLPEENLFRKYFDKKLRELKIEDAKTNETHSRDSADKISPR